MKQFGGWYLPDGETHLVEWMQKVGDIVDGRHAYQHAKLKAALPLVREFRCAVDVGAHVGLWSYYLAKQFRTIHAFEPVAAHQECFIRNLGQCDGGLPGNVLLYSCALGNETREVSLHTGPSSSGDTYVQDGGEHTARMRTLDSFDLTDVDLLKIDCEGYEKFVIEGGEQTIRRDRPVIIVEQKPGKAAQFGLGDTDAVTLLQSWGAKLDREISGDFILSW